jgi:hypothetical protein
MSPDDDVPDPTAELRRIGAERAIGEGRKRHQLVVGELFPDGNVAAQWVFSLTALVEDLSVLTHKNRVGFGIIANREQIDEAWAFHEGAVHALKQLRTLYGARRSG